MASPPRGPLAPGLPRRRERVLQPAGVSGGRVPRGPRGGPPPRVLPAGARGKGLGALRGVKGASRGAPMAKVWLFLGSVSGLIAVAAGAFGAHALRERLTLDLLNAFET